MFAIKKIPTIFFLVFTFSCQESQSNIIVSQDWSKFVLTPSNKLLVDGSMPLILTKDYLICLGQTDNDGSVVYKIDIKTGTKIWGNSDVFGSNGKYIWVSKPPHLFNNILCIYSGWQSLAINVTSGKTIWKKPLEKPIQQHGGIGNYCFGLFIEPPKDVSEFHIGNIQNGANKLLWEVPKKIGCNAGIGISDPYINKNGDTLIVPFFTYYNKKTYEAEDNFALYSVTKRRVVYTQNITPFSRLSGGLRGTAIYKDHVYFATGFYFVCHRLKDGKQIWKKEIPTNIGTITVADGRLLGSANNGVLYCFDAFTGKELWQRGGISSNNPPLYMNGVFYATNFYLYAVDAKTGALLWQKESPDNRENSQSGFISNVVGANGKIYVSSFLNLYCFKAAR